MLQLVVRAFESEPTSCTAGTPRVKLPDTQKYPSHRSSEELRIPQRPHGRGTRRVREEPEFAHALAAADVVDPLLGTVVLLDEDSQSPAEHDVERVSQIFLSKQILACREGHPLQLRRELREHARVEAFEERHRGQEPKKLFARRPDGARDALIDCSLEQGARARVLRDEPFETAAWQPHHDDVRLRAGRRRAARAAQ